jgi:hypothetical protein
MPSRERCGRSGMPMSRMWGAGAGWSPGSSSLGWAWLTPRSGWMWAALPVRLGGAVHGQRTCAELGIDAVLRTVLILDQAAAQGARFLGPRRCGWRAAMLILEWSCQPSTSWSVASTGMRIGWPAIRSSAGSAMPSWLRSAGPQQLASRPTRASRSPPGDEGGAPRWQVQADRLASRLRPQ